MSGATMAHAMTRAVKRLVRRERPREKAGPSRDRQDAVDQSLLTVDNPYLRKLITEGGFHYDGRFWPFTPQVTRFDRLALYAERIVAAGYTRGLEIGTFIGLSTVFLAEALARNNGTLDTIDIRLQDQRWGEKDRIHNAYLVAEMFVREAELSNVTFLRGRSQDVLPKRPRRYDFAHIDGDHNYYAVVMDFILVDSMLDVGGLVVLDDIGKKIAVREDTDGGPARLLPHIFASGRYRVELISSNQALCTKLREVG
jgi:predicted O-methyltransferase YrrM